MLGTEKAGPITAQVRKISQNDEFQSGYARREGVDTLS